MNSPEGIMASPTTSAQIGETAAHITPATEPLSSAKTMHPAYVLAPNIHTKKHCNP